MAVIYSHDFESYADGSAAMLADGWTDSQIEAGYSVVSNFAHGGSKSVRLGADIIGAGQIQRRPLTLGRSVSISGWFYRENSGGTYAFGVGLFTPNSLSGIYLATLNADPSQVVVVDDNADTIASSASGVLSGDGWHHLRLDVYLSTVTATLDDVNANGCARCYVNGTLVIDIADAKVFADQSEWGAGINRVTGARWFAEGWVDDVEVNDDVVPCASTTPGGGDPPPNESDPCCGGHPDPGNPTGPNPGEPPIYPPLQPWERACLGGGEVPTGADVVDLESWVL